MTIGLNASQARSKSSQDMIIFNETDAIMRGIIEASASGAYEVIIDDGTVMTESTPMSTIIGDVQYPTVIVGSTLIINGYTVVLGTTATNLNGIIADINDANIPGVFATKTDGYLVIQVSHVQQTTWTYEIGAGTANIAIGIDAGVYVASNPTSIEYFNTWQGLLVDRALVVQMNAVINHFKNLGYKIEQLTNTSTSKTFKWHVYW